MSKDIKSCMQDIGRRATEASRLLATARTSCKNLALQTVAQSLEFSIESLRKANQIDLKAAEEKGLDAAMLDRLELTPDRIKAMANGLREIAALDDPVGQITDMSFRPSGIQVGRMRVPLGVIGIIYESRPNVTADAAALCLKSGNASILRGGSEAIHSNRAIAAMIQSGLEEAGLPRDGVQVIDTPDRAVVGELLKMRGVVDVIIPRGGKSLIERVSEESRIPVIKHLDGICHVFIDDDADLNKAFEVAINAKTHRYGVCNAMETLLVSRGIAPQILPRLAERLRELGVELRVCEKTSEWIPDAEPATEADWDTEYLAPILSIKTVAGIDEAIDHIDRHGSGHTDAIVTESMAHAQRFLREVDSSSVMINASTRFADGFEYGLGAEIGISTDKLHVRGPVGLEGLTSLKYIVFGNGHIRK